MGVDDLVSKIRAVDRKVVDRDITGRRERVVIATRPYDAAMGDVWDALTAAERISRWLLPVSGDLRLGGRYQLEGNAGGEVLECEPPHHLKVTWEYGGAISWVDVRLSAEAAQRTLFRLEHSSPDSDDHWDEFGPGAVGVGWDLTLVGLGEHLSTGDSVDPDWESSAAAKAFIRLSSDDWCRAAIAAGTPEHTARRAAARTTAAYTSEPPAPS